MYALGVPQGYRPYDVFYATPAAIGNERCVHFPILFTATVIQNLAF
jgi:hypothetical protein